MKTVCCVNMPFAQEAFRTLGAVVAKDGRMIAPDDVRDANLLAIRSTTRVDAGLLEGSSVRFVGSAVIGTDHLDIPYLDRRGIRWCSAAGCNAESVAEYVTAALLCLAVRHGLSLAGKTIGVVGVGHVGRLVVEKARALGLRVLQNDPPRQRAEGGIEFVSLDQVLAESDILTLHVPLTKTGTDATLRMADSRFFARLKPGCIYLNAARGGVNVTDALLAAMDRGIVAHAVVDCWEGEPAYRADLLQRADLATPHIAGHSFEGKVMGTVMVYQAACRFLDVQPTWSHEPLMPPPLAPEIAADASGRRPEAVLHEIVRRVYDIEADDRRLRDGAAADERARAGHFDRLRREYPVRREFRFSRVTLRNAPADLGRTVAALGFRAD
jgi:erythronate-4-phosphate dehydrogenase